MCLSRKKIYHLGLSNFCSNYLMEKHLASLCRRKREDSSKIVSEKGDIKTDAIEVKSIIGVYKEQLIIHQQIE